MSRRRRVYTVRSLDNQRLMLEALECLRTTEPPPAKWKIERIERMTRRLRARIRPSESESSTNATRDEAKAG